MTTPRWRPAADAVWLAGHDSTDGKPVLQPETLATGLAAALLAELVIRQWITVDPQTRDEAARIRLRAPESCGHLEPVEGCPVCPLVTWNLGDAAEQAVLDGLRRRLREVWSASADRTRIPTQDLQTWIRYMQEPADRRYLDRPVTELVEQRLSAAGVIHQVERGLIRRKLVWAPRNSADAGGATKTIGLKFRERASLAPDDFLLTALVFAIGLDAAAFDLLKPAERDELKKRALLALPEPLQVLLLTTQSIHHKAVLIR